MGVVGRSWVRIQAVPEVIRSGLERIGHVPAHEWHEELEPGRRNGSNSNIAGHALDPALHGGSGSAVPWVSGDR
jgi:hypothetical protein